MNGREKIMAALSKEGSREIAATICYEGIYIRDRWDELTKLPWWYRESSDIEQRMACIKDVYGKLDPDFIVLPFGPPPDSIGRYKISDDGGRVYVTDAETGERGELVRPPVGGSMISLEAHFEGADINTPEEFDRVAPASDYVRSLTRDVTCELPNAVAAAFPDRCHISYLNAPIEQCFYFFGYEKTMLLLVDNPGLIAHAAKRFAEYQRRLIANAKKIGVQMFWLEECYSDLISPEQYRLFSLPYLRAVIEEAHAVGIKCVHYYTGNPHDRLDILLETGADAIGFEESKKNFVIDIIDMAERIKGKCALLSNIDAMDLMRFGSTEQLEAEIIRHTQAARIMDGRFMYGLGSPLTPDTPLARVKEYLSLARKHGSI